MIFDGRDFAKKMESELQDKANIWSKRNGRRPKIAFFLVGNNPEGELFIKRKQLVASLLSIDVSIHRYRDNLMSELTSLSQNSLLDGIVVQLPLPPTLKKNQQLILDQIDSKKDIDGLTTISFELLKQGKTCFLPAVVKATLKILETYKLANGQSVIAVVGAKGWVGQRIVLALRNLGYSRTLEIGHHCEEHTLDDLKKSDLVISCVGQPNLIRGEMIKENAAVIDLGMMIVEKKGLSGDINFEEVSKKASFVTPVPGGVGPVTVACLFENLLLGPTSDI